MEQTMKKSEAFRLAQLCVLADETMSITGKVKVLEVLLWEESFAKMVEEVNEKKKKEAGKCDTSTAE